MGAPGIFIKVCVGIVIGWFVWQRFNPPKNDVEAD